MNRRDFLLTSAAMVATGVVGEGLLERAAAANTKTSAIDPDLKMMDLHVHRSEQQSIEQIVEKSQRLGIPIGVMENVAPWGITTNEQMQAYIDSIRPYPVYVGLQPMSPGWSKNFSKDIIAQADYIAMDPQIVPNGNGYGETIQVWEYATYIDDP